MYSVFFCLTARQFGGKGALKLRCTTQQLLTQFGAKGGEGFFFGTMQRFDEGAGVVTTGVGQAQQFAAAIVVVLFYVQQATIHQVVALRGDGLFGDTPQGADVALCAGFFRVERVEDGEGGGVDAPLFRPAVVEAEDVGEDAAQLEAAVGFWVLGGFRWRGRDGSLQTGLRPGGEPKAVCISAVCGAPYCSSGFTVLIVNCPV